LFLLDSACTIVPTTTITTTLEPGEISGFVWSVGSSVSLSSLVVRRSCGALSPLERATEPLEAERALEWLLAGINVIHGKEEGKKRGTEKSGKNRPELSAPFLYHTIPYHCTECRPMSFFTFTFYLTKLWARKGRSARKDTCTCVEAPFLLAVAARRETPRTSKQSPNMSMLTVFGAVQYN